MNPRILALMAQAAGETVAGVGSGVSKIDWLSPEQRNKMKELERQQALGLLGLDEAAQQRILNQQLQPVQAVGRQAAQQAQQSQLIGDVGQGAAFRQQAAQQGALQQATIDATQRAQQQIAQMDELARARQLAEMRALQQQRQKTKEGMTDIVGSLAGGAAMAAHIGAAKKDLETYEGSLLNKAQQKQMDALKKMGGKTTPKFRGTFLEALQSLRSSIPVEEEIVPRIVPEKPTWEELTEQGWQSIGSPSGPTFTLQEALGIVPSVTTPVAPDVYPVAPDVYPVAPPVAPPVVPQPKTVSWGVLTPILDLEGNIVQFSYVSRTGKTGTLDASARGSNGLTAMDEYLAGE